MDVFSDPLLNFWRAFGDWGLIVVILAVFLEVAAAATASVLAKLKIENLEKWESRLKRYEVIAGWILVIGLAMEYKGHKEETSILDASNMQLISETNEAETNSAASLAQAAKAEKEAAEANERAVLIESNNLVLQKELHPRIITQKQMKDFIFLTENLPKLPIRVATGMASAEAENYAWQIRNLLNAAKFPVPDSDTNQFLGIDWIANAITLPAPEHDKPLVDVQFMSGTTNNYSVLHFLREEQTNGFERFYISTNDTASVYAAIWNYFNQIGISTLPGYAPAWVLTNSCVVYINPKVQ